MKKDGGWAAAAGGGGGNLTFYLRPDPLCAPPAAEEQVHEEVAQRRRGLQRAGGRGGLPGRPLRGVCPPAASCDAWGPDGGARSHKVLAVPWKNKMCGKRSSCLSLKGLGFCSVFFVMCGPKEE